MAEADAAFPELAERDTEELLPQRPRTARCRICGLTTKLSKEHVPPRGAFNTRTARSHTFDEWLARDGVGVMPGGVLEQGGVWGYTLCESCNNLTGSKYADEYRNWALGAVATLRGTDVEALQSSTVQPQAHFTIAAPRPGAFLREVLAMMCSVSGGFDIAGRWPAIRRMILDASVEPLPTGVTVGLTMFLGGHPRIVGPQVTGTPRKGWRVVMEVALPPFATTMVLGGTYAIPHMFDLTPFALVPPDERQAVEGDIEVGFGNTVYPGDYRTRAMVEAQAALAALRDGALR